MRLSWWWLLLPLGVISTRPEESSCTHSSAGESKPVSLEQVGRAQDELRKRLTLAWDKAARIAPDGPFDSGLPSCKSRQSRRLKTRLPPDLVGKSIAFAPSDRMPAADIRVAASARRLLDLRADALADPKLVQRLGVRCSPTIVRAVSEVELELIEDP